MLAIWSRFNSRATLSIALLQGFSILAACLGVFLLARKDHTVDAARALTFVTLVVAFVIVILVNRSWLQSAVAMLRVPNPAVRWVLLGAAVFLALAILVPFARKSLHFAPLHLTDLLLSLGAGLLGVLWFEVVKHRSHREDASAGEQAARGARATPASGDALGAASMNSFQESSGRPRFASELGSGQLRPVHGTGRSDSAESAKPSSGP